MPSQCSLPTLRMVDAMPGTRFVVVGRVLLLAALLPVSATAQAQARRLTVDTPSGEIHVRSEAIKVKLYANDANATAEMHAYGYFAEGGEQRPLMFLWNGGPGGSSALLHSGFAAPQVADLAEGTGMAANPLTMIDRCDLIYVDPIGTGFSRSIGKGKDEDFWNVRADAQAAAQFVAAVLADHNWQKRDIYLCGESYGGIRVGAMLKPLRKLRVEVAGLVMISPALETRALWSRDNEDQLVRRHVDNVPTLAAIAVADGKREAEGLRADVDAVCKWALGPLLKAVSNQEVDWEDDDQLVDKVERLTAGGRSTRGMRRDRYDARMKAKPNYLCGVSTAVLHTSVGAILKNAFGVASVEDYEFMNRSATSSWHERKAGKGRYPWDVRATDMIAEACKNGRGPRVFVASGWYDMIVPFTIARRLQQQGAFGSCEVIVKDYPGGHALYVDPDAHKAFIADLRSWLGCKSV
ncbi:MAG: pimeloyl-ACP methyl ester carboxylesterase [Planctomycetota bacterium]